MAPVVFMVRCAMCGEEFDRGYRISAKRASNPQYCSKACRSYTIRNTPAETIRSLRTRFEVMVVRREQGECWAWNGRKNASGYGVIDHVSRPRLAHRISYFLHTGFDPSEFSVCHKCDNPECTNPDHLWLGSHQDNMADASAKGRMTGGPRGSQVGSSKLNESDVLEIRASSETDRQIAARYGVTKEAIHAIRTRKNWGWLRG